MEKGDTRAAGRLCVDLTLNLFSFEFLGWSGDMWCWANGWGVDCALESIQDMHCISIRKTQIYLTRLNDRE
jgi:hypothetical protein